MTFLLNTNETKHKMTTGLYKLSLHDVRDPGDMTELCYGTLEELQAFLISERVSAYVGQWKDLSYHKYFRRGGPLEWYYPGSLVKMKTLQEFKEGTGQSPETA
jgi:hypothetical protein